MPRPRAFVEDDVLDAAVRVFWEYGYDATSTAALCRATGLSHGSLYNTFSSKPELFRRALQRYMQQSTAAVRHILAADGVGRAKVEALIRRAVEPDPDDPTGCFVVNSMIVHTGREDPVAVALREDEAIRLAALCDAIEHGQRDGSIRSTRTAHELGQFVLAVISGLRVAARAGADAEVREAVAATAMDALRPGTAVSDLDG